MANLSILLQQSVEQWWQSYADTNSRVLRYCQILLMTSILFLSLTSAGIQQLLWRNMEQLLGADLVISHQQPLAESALSQLAQFSERTSVSKLTDITLAHGEKWQPVQLKVVDSAYPLRGSVQTASGLGEPSMNVQALPRHDEIWLDSRTFTALDVAIGDVISVAGAALRVTAIITHEPDRLMEGHSVAHRALISTAAFNQHMLTETNVTYRYSFEIAEHTLPTAVAWANNALAHTQVLHASSGHPLASFWQRVENFFGLVMVALFFMAAITFSLSGKRQLAQQLFRFSVFLSVGVTRQQAIFIWSMQWLIGFIVNVMIASGIAYLSYRAMLQVFAAHFGLALPTTTELSLIGTLPPMPWRVWGQSVVLLAVLLLLFQAPFWMKLFQTSPASLLKKSVEGQRTSVIWLFNTTVICLLAFVYSDNPLLTSMILAGLVTSLLLMAAITWLLLSFGEKLSESHSGLVVFCIGLMKQRMSSKATQIMGLGLCLTLMLFSFGLMRDFSDMLQRYTRTHDGNVMIAQVSQPQVAGLQQWAARHDAEILVLKPFYYAQLERINGKTVAEAITYPSESSATIKKPIRLHTSAALPQNNRLVSGEFWRADHSLPDQISVESEVMMDLGLALGDTLQFRVDEQRFQFEISATHAFQSGAGSVTFWFQVPKVLQTLVNQPPMFMGSMELAESAWPHLASLWQTMPTLKMVTLKEITQRFDNTLALLQITLAIFASLILLLSLLVIVATIQGFEKQDKMRNGLMLSFGLSTSECIRLVAWEWIITGVIASISAIIGTVLIGHLMYQSQFSMHYQVDWPWLGFITGITVMASVSLGLLFSRGSLQVSIRQLLDEA